MEPGDRAAAVSAGGSQLGADERELSFRGALGPKSQGAGSIASDSVTDAEEGAAGGAGPADPALARAGGASRFRTEALGAVAPAKDPAPVERPQTSGASPDAPRGFGGWGTPKHRHVGSMSGRAMVGHHRRNREC